MCTTPSSVAPVFSRHSFESLSYVTSSNESTGSPVAAKHAVPRSSQGYQERLRTPFELSTRLFWTPYRELFVWNQQLLSLGCVAPSNKKNPCPVLFSDARHFFFLVLEYTLFSSLALSVAGSVPSFYSQDELDTQDKQGHCPVGVWQVLQVGRVRSC